MLYPTSIHTWPQNLDFAQIEAIVQAIEQEKEAGKAEQASDILNYAHVRDHPLQRRRGSAQGWRLPLQAKQPWRPARGMRQVHQGNSCIV
jgi:hypothetical protein